MSKDTLLKNSKLTADGEIMLSKKRGLSFDKSSLILLNFLNTNFLNSSIFSTLIENPPAILCPPPFNKILS